MSDNILPPDESWQFTYDRARREVTNITLEPETNTIIGFERTKSKRPSDKIKRYSVEKMKNVKKQ